MFESNQFVINLENFSKKKIGYFKIIDILSKDSKTINQCLDIVQDNLIYFGISNRNTLYELIGIGEFGIAFKFMDKVLKITTSKEEFETCTKLVDLDLMGVVKYYLTFQFSDLPLWIIIQDKLDELPKIEKDIYTLMYYMGANDISHKNFEYGNKENLFEELKKRVKSPLKEDEIDSYQITNKKLKNYFNKYFDLVDKLNLEGVSTDDLHGENIGLRDGELIQFDVMIA